MSIHHLCAPVVPQFNMIPVLWMYSVGAIESAVRPAVAALDAALHDVIAGPGTHTIERIYCENPVLRVMDLWSL